MRKPKAKPIEAKPETPAGPAWVVTEVGEALVAGGQPVASIRLERSEARANDKDAHWSASLGRKTSGVCFSSDIATARARVETELRAAGRGDLVPAALAS